MRLSLRHPSLQRRRRARRQGPSLAAAAFARCAQTQGGIYRRAQMCCRSHTPSHRPRRLSRHGRGSRPYLARRRGRRDFPQPRAGNCACRLFRAVLRHWHRYRKASERGGSLRYCPAGTDRKRTPQSWKRHRSLHDRADLFGQGKPVQSALSDRQTFVLFRGGGVIRL
ncbi:hypothetical protein D3C80_1672500 [compost metagenome]